MKNLFKGILVFYILILGLNEAIAQTVYITKTGTKYHRETCRYAKTGYRSDLETAKKKGLGPCSVCKPSQSNQSSEGNSKPSETLNTEPNRISSNNEKSVRCKAITKAGAQCSRNSTDDSGYCWQHKN